MASYSAIRDGLDTDSRSDYEDEGVDFKICKNLKMTSYSQNNLMIHLKLRKNFVSLI